MRSHANKLFATLTMLVAIGLFAVMSPAQSQDQGQGQANQNQANQNPSPANEVTATGCLAKSGSGQYTLTDQASSQTYALTSSSVDLSAHVGHTVTVTGSPEMASASGEPASPSAPSMLNVSKLQMVSNSCSGGGGTPPSEPPTSQPPQSR